MKRMKKLLAIFLCVLMTVQLAVPVWAADETEPGTTAEEPETPPAATSGTCGTGLTWNLSDGGTLTISGTGVIDNYRVTSSDSVTTVDAPWFAHAADIQLVVIESGVTGIGTDAFALCTNLKSVTLPNGMTSIGAEAFMGCTSLSAVTIPGSVEVIGERAFHSCTALASIALPDGLKTIGNLAFWSSGLTGVTIPDSVTVIENGAFYFCQNLKTAVLSRKLTVVETNAFGMCSALETVEIFPGVTSIRKNAFTGCNSLAAVTLPEGLTTIEEGAFISSTGLKAVMLPKSLTLIGGGAFFETGLTDVFYAGTEAEWAAVSAGGNDELAKAAMHYEATGIGELTPSLPDASSGSADKPTPPPEEPGQCGENLRWELSEDGTLTISGTGAMTSYSGLSPWSDQAQSITSVVLESGVTDIGGNAFMGCNRIASFTVPESLTEIGGNAFNNAGNGSVSVYYAGTLERWLTIAHGDGIMRNGGSLYCGGTLVTEAALPDGLKKVPDNAFYGCRDLVSVTIPDGVKSVGSHAFAKCPKLAAVTIPDSVAAFGEYAFEGCAALTSVHIPDGVKALSDGVFSGCAALTSAAIPDSVTVIGKNAFDFTGLTSVNIPENVTDIGAEAFSGCAALESAALPEKLKTIGKYAFSHTGLTSAVLPDGVTSLGDGAFNGAEKLRSVTLSQKLTSLPEGAFAGCAALTEITVPEGVVSLGQYAFARCPALTAVHLPVSLTYVGEGAFSGCGKIAVHTADLDKWKTIGFDSADANPLYGGGTLYCGGEPVAVLAFSADTQSVGSYAFYNCAGLTSVTVAETAAARRSVISGGKSAAARRRAPALKNSATGIGDYAFYSCPDLTSVTVPDGIAHIGESAFENCAALTAVTILSGDTTCAETAFCGCAALTDAYYYGTEAQWESSGFAAALPDVTVHYMPGTTPTLPEGELALKEVAGQLDEEGDGEAIRLDIGGRAYGADQTVVVPTGKTVLLSATTTVSGSDSDDGSPLHAQYPADMAVFKAVNDGDNGVTVQRIAELDGLLRYAGSSIRITGKQGIRMITAISGDLKNRLVNGGVAGYTVQEYGTLLCFASEMQNGSLALSDSYARHNYAYSRANGADPVFRTVGDSIQYTNVLVGFSDEQCKDDIAMRPYITLRDENGTDVTLYGGIVYRSIGYIAYQNRSAFAPGTDAYHYIWRIIHYVYGDKFDEDYKG